MNDHKQLRIEYRLTNDGDGFGTCMAWLFTIAAELAIRGDGPPDAWQYNPGIFGPHHAADCYEAEILAEYDTETILWFGEVLRRYREKLAVAGLDY